MIVYHWKEWLALESAAVKLVVLECNDKFGFDGLDELARSIKSDCKKIDKPLLIHLCKPLYFELDYLDFIDDFICCGNIFTVETIEDSFYAHIGYCEDIEYSLDDASSVENLRKAVKLFEAIHRPLLWFYKGWEIDSINSFFPLSIILRSAIKKFNQANKNKFVLYEPIEDFVRLDCEYWES
jgi:hypothetical protein